MSPERTTFTELHLRTRLHGWGSSAWTPTPPSPMVRTVSRIIAILSLGVGLIAVAVAVTSSKPFTADHGEVQNHFGILRTRSERPSPAVATRIQKALVAYEAPALLRDTQFTRASGPVWIFYTRRQLCLAEQHGAVCASTARAVREGVFLGTFSSPTKRIPYLHNFLVQGVVPDGVRQVAVTVGARHTRVVPVMENVFSVAAEQPVHVKRLLR